jgi:hypothetical protein
MFFGCEPESCCCCCCCCCCCSHGPDDDFTGKELALEDNAQGYVGRRAISQQVTLGAQLTESFLLVVHFARLHAKAERQRCRCMLTADVSALSQHACYRHVHTTASTRAIVMYIRLPPRVLSSCTYDCLHACYRHVHTPASMAAPLWAAAYRYALAAVLAAVHLAVECLLCLQLLPCSDIIPCLAVRHPSNISLWW